MTSEFLMEAIGQMDDDLLLEAAEPRKYIPWKQAAGLAAAIVLCVGIARIPGLSRNGAFVGAAAPEAESTMSGLLADTADGAEDYEYRSEQESQVQEPSAEHKSESMTAGGTQQGVVEPQFFTERGVYLLADPPQRTQPPMEGAKELGALAAYRYGESNYPAVWARELVGCPAWESADGEYLYIQQNDGYWLTARLIK